jgi:hypothetical protein
MADTIPPLPEGFELEQPSAQSTVPPLPAGFELESDTPITDLPQVNALPPDFSGVTSSVDSTAEKVAPDGWAYGAPRDAAFGVRSAIQGIGGTLGAIGGDAFNNYIANPIARTLGFSAELAKAYPL